jgi:cytochrome c553
MDSQTVLITITIAGLVAAPALAQRRPYNLVMKDIGATVEVLRKDLDSDLAVAAATATKLEGLLKETEDFWTEFKTKDAIDAAKGGQGVARAVAAAARNKDVQNAKNAASGLGKFCTACHNSHREQQPDKSYRIKP